MTVCPIMTLPQNHTANPPTVVHSKLGAGRRVAIPAELCQQYQLNPGDPVVLESSENGITIRSYADVLREIQEYFRDDAPRDTLLSDELIAERRREAAMESRD